MSDDTITLDREAVQAIRRALVVGLSCYGEVERICNSVRIIREFGGRTVHEELVPVHPTGSIETIGDFSNALAYLI